LEFVGAPLIARHRLQNVLVRGLDANRPRARTEGEAPENTVIDLTVGVTGKIRWPVLERAKNGRCESLARRGTAG
jgi:hypothetical protein